MTPPVGRAPPHQISLDRPHVLRGGQWAENSHFAHTLAPVSSHWVFCGHTHRPSLGVFGAATDLPEPPPPGAAGSAAKNPRCDPDFQRSASAVSLRSMACFLAAEIGDPEPHASVASIDYCLWALGQTVVGTILRAHLIAL